MSTYSSYCMCLHGTFNTFSLLGIVLCIVLDQFDTHRCTQWTCQIYSFLLLSHNMLWTPYRCISLNYSKWDWLHWVDWLDHNRLFCSSVHPISPCKVLYKFDDNNYNDNDNTNDAQLKSRISQQFLPAFLHGARLHGTVSTKSSQYGFVDRCVRFFSPIPHVPTQSDSTRFLYVPSHWAGVVVWYWSSSGCCGGGMLLSCPS